MRLLRFLLRTAGTHMLGFVLVSLGASMANAGLLSVVHRAIGGDRSRDWVLWFAVAGSGRLITSYWTGHILSHQERHSLRTLRDALIHKVVQVPLARLERLGKARIITSLNDDVARLQSAMQALSSVFSAATITVGGCAYMLYLSPRAFAVLSVLGMSAAVIHRAITERARRHFVRARDADEQLQARQRDLVEGMRELRLDRDAREALLGDGILAASDRAAEHRLRGRKAHLLARSLTQLPAMLAILSILAGVGLDGTLQDSAGFVLAALYISGSTAAVIGNSGAFSQAAEALHRIEGLVDDLTAAEGPAVARATRPEFSGLTLRGVRYQREPDGFELGPIDLTLEPGQIVFITGDNGSGKSTLALVLLGLYEPSEGEVALSGGGASLAESQLASAVFGDPFLFDRPWGIPPERLQQASAWMERLDIPHPAGASAWPDPERLSQGQRKRLSLLQCLLSARPVLFLDEFVANQDELHRRWFYRELLPQLRAEGRTVVVVSHDQAYFDAADRRVHLSNGRVVTG